MVEQVRTFDLNVPEDARAYVQDWIDRGILQLGEEIPADHINIATDEELLYLARYLFIRRDHRPVLGSIWKPH